MKTDGTAENNDENDVKMNAIEAISGDKPVQSKVNNDEDILNPVDGWIDIDRSKISYDGQLYPKSYRFQVKPVTVSTIKYFSTLDERNPISVGDALTYVVKNHIRIFDGKRLLDTLETIYEHDRFFFVLIVHVYSGAPTSLTYKTKCTNTNCNASQDVNLTPYNIRYSKLSDKGLGYLNSTIGKFVVNTKTLGEFVYRPLTLHESSELTSFMVGQKNENNDIEQFFLQCSAFLAHSTQLGDDPSLVYQKYLKLTSNDKVVSLILELCKHIDVRQLLEADSTCTKCRLPFYSPISSINGLKHIFLISDISEELS